MARIAVGSDVFPDCTRAEGCPVGLRGVLWDRGAVQFSQQHPDPCCLFTYNLVNHAACSCTRKFCSSISSDMPGKIKAIVALSNHLFFLIIFFFPFAKHVSGAST